MKYYKALTSFGWRYYKKGKIYPSNYEKCGICISESVLHYPKDFQEVSEEEYLIQEGKIFVEIINIGEIFDTHPKAKEYGLVNYHYWKGLNTAENGDIFEVVKELIVNDNTPSYILKDKEGIEYLIGKAGCKIVKGYVTMEKEFAVKVEGGSYNNNARDIVNFLVSKGFENSNSYVGQCMIPNNYIINNGKITNCTSFVDNNIKIYTLEELKNKLDNSKKLIGYKLSKPEFKKAAVSIEGFKETGFSNIEDRVFNIKDHSESIDKWKKAEVLDLWFEPVYEEEFKVGDWVVFESDRVLKEYPSLYTTTWNKDHILQVGDVTDLNLYFFNQLGRSSISNSIRCFRKATPEEIEKAQIPNVTIKGHKAKLEEDSVSFGCQTYSKDFVLQLGDFIDNSGIAVGYSRQIKEVVNYFKNK